MKSFDYKFKCSYLTTQVFFEKIIIRKKNSLFIAYSEMKFNRIFFKTLMAENVSEISSRPISLESEK